MSEPAGPDPGSLAARSRRRRPVGRPHPPVARPRLRLELDRDVLLQSRARHPSTSPGCRTCGFAPPARARIVDAARRLPTTWAAALAGGDRARLRNAAFLRDEIHGVTNRVMRLVAQPGARLLPVTVPIASAERADVVCSRTVIHVMQLAVDRMVETIRSLQPDDWDIEGMVVDTGRSVSVRGLLLVPLHHSHRDLAVLTADAIPARFC